MTALAPARLPRPSVSVAALAWTLAALLFLLLRVGLVWRAPVGGPELDHLAGAWLASLGIEDARYVPTLFQSLTALTFSWTDSEIPARALALAGSLAIPPALYLLRRPLGEGGALLALLLLALDPLAIVLGATASAAAWDAAIVLWLVVALVASRPPPAAWLPLAFLLATAGPLVLPAVLAAFAIAALRGARPSPAALAWGAGGTALGLLLASVQFGLGGDGLRVPSFVLFADGFEASWSSLTLAPLAALYGLPLLAGGVAAPAWLVARLRAENRPATPAEMLTLGMGAFALLWFLASLPAASPFPLAAATLAAALLLGPALARLASLAAAAPLGEARYLLPAAFLLAATAAVVLSDWARRGAVGDEFSQGILAASLILAAMMLALLATWRGTLPLLPLPALALGGVLLVATASGVALSAAGEPLPSPISPASARDARDVALEAAAGGPIVVHERYREALTWPFRGAGEVRLAARVPPDAAVAVWPADAPPPEGFAPLAGRWTFERAFHPPRGFLAWLHWFGERNSLERTHELVVIYVRPSP